MNAAACRFLFAISSASFSKTNTTSDRSFRQCPIYGEYLSELLAEYFHAVHFRLEAASAMVAASFSPDGPSEALDGAQSFVPHSDAGAVLLPGLGVPSMRNNGVRPSVRDGVAAVTSVVGAVGGDRGNRFALGDLAEQVGLQRRIAHAAAGKLDRANFQSRLVHGQMNLAPNTPARPAMLAPMLFAFAADLDARAVYQQVQ